MMMPWFTDTTVRETFDEQVCANINSGELVRDGKQQDVNEFRTSTSTSNSFHHSTFRNVHAEVSSHSYQENRSMSMGDSNGSESSAINCPSSTKLSAQKIKCGKLVNNGDQSRGSLHAARAPVKRGKGYLEVAFSRYQGYPAAYGFTRHAGVVDDRIPPHLLMLILRRVRLTEEHLRDLLIDRIGTCLPIEMINIVSARFCAVRVATPNVATMLRVWLSFYTKSEPRPSHHRAMHFTSATLTHPLIRGELIRLLQEEYASFGYSIEHLEAAAFEPTNGDHIARAYYRFHSAYKQLSSSSHPFHVTVVPGYGNWFIASFYGFYKIGGPPAYIPYDANCTLPLPTVITIREKSERSLLSDQEVVSSESQAAPDRDVSASTTSAICIVGSVAEARIKLQSECKQEVRIWRFEVPVFVTIDADRSKRLVSCTRDLDSSEEPLFAAPIKRSSSKRLAISQLEIAQPQVSGTASAPNQPPSSGLNLEEVSSEDSFPTRQSFLSCIDAICGHPRRVCPTKGAALRRVLLEVRQPIDNDRTRLEQYMCRHPLCGQRHRSVDCRYEYPTAWHSCLLPAGTVCRSRGADIFCLLCGCAGHRALDCPLLHGELDFQRRFSASSEIWAKLDEAETETDTGSTQYTSQLQRRPIRDQLWVRLADGGWSTPKSLAGDAGDSAGYFEYFGSTLESNEALASDVEVHFEHVFEDLTRRLERCYRHRSNSGIEAWRLQGEVAEAFAYYYAVRGVFTARFNDLPDSMRCSVSKSLKHAGFAPYRGDATLHFWLSPNRKLLRWCRVDNKQPRRLYRPDCSHMMLTDAEVDVFVGRRRVSWLSVDSPHWNVSYALALQKEAACFGALDDLRLDADYSVFAFAVQSDGDFGDARLMRRMPLIASLVRRRLERLALSTLATAIEHAGLWVASNALAELSALLETDERTARCLCIGRLAGALFTQYSDSDSDPDPPRPIDIRFRTANDHTLSIQQAHQLGEITNEEFEEAEKFLVQLEKLILRAFRAESREQQEEILREYVCPYAQMQTRPLTTSEADVFAEQVALARDLYASDCTADAHLASFTGRFSNSNLM